MIPKAAVDKYLSAPRDDHRWIKELTHEQLDEALSELRPQPQLFEGLHLHQKVCILLGIAYPHFSYWCDLGSGKTLTALELLRYWYEAEIIRRGIVFVTSDKAYATWEKQIKRFDIDIPYVSLEGDSASKWDQLLSLDSGLVLVHYPGAVAMSTEIVELRRKRKKKKVEWQLDDRLVAELKNYSDALVLDESTRVGHYKSLAHKLVRELSTQAHACYAMAGRPFGRDPTMLWSQQFIVDGGASLGPTLGLFREAFFTSRANPFSKNKHSKKFTFDKRKQAKLSRLVQHRSITYTAEECVDLPPVSAYIEELNLGEEVEAYYKRLVKKIIAAKGNLREMKNVFMQMRQLSSGFLGFRDDETGERADVEFDQNPKRDRLLEFIDVLPAGRKAVVFYEFTYSGRTLTELIKDMGLDSIWLWSGTEDPREQLRFENDPDCTVAVINNKVGAYSLDGLQDVANYTFFYESPVSPIDREQAERRVRRQGQKHHVFQYDLIVKGTADRKILGFHKEGRDLFESVLKDPALLIN